MKVHTDVKNKKRNSITVEHCDSHDSEGVNLGNIKYFKRFLRHYCLRRDFFTQKFYKKTK